MIIGNITQQPIEALDYDIDYQFWLAKNDSIQSAIVAVDIPGLIVDILPLPEEKRIKLWISGGLDNIKYKIEITMTTTQGRVKQDEIIVKIREV